MGFLRTTVPRPARGGPACRSAERVKLQCRFLRGFGGVSLLVVLTGAVAASVMLARTPAPVQAAGLAQTRGDLAATRTQLARLQDEFDQLAGDYSRAEARLYEIDDAIAKTGEDEARSRQDLHTMQERMTDRIVRLYKSTHSAVPAFLEIVFEERDFTSVIERLRFLNTVAAQDEQTFSEVGRHLRKVRDLQAELDVKKSEQTATLVELQQAQDRMEGRMKAAAAEYSRLKKRVAVLEEEARRAAEAARARAKNAVSNSKGAAAAARGFVFPVDGPHSYTNDWGFPRSGGRSHKGTDIMAARGTPVVAVVSGRIRRTAYNSGLGGTIIWLDGSNGVSYYYAHLDGIAAGVRGGTSVRAGQVIGYVGNSGNARGGGHHLHFEIHPGGGGAINPYSVLRASD